ncbi:hypothetical protein ABT373_21080 [Streptomyces sp. NPDC000070]
MSKRSVIRGPPPRRRDHDAEAYAPGDTNGSPRVGGGAPVMSTKAN